jgi:FkbM family methyltransferase
MNGIYIGENKILVKTVYGGNLITPSTDLSITPQLVLTGAMELPLTKYIFNFVKQGNMVVDIGANIGYFTVLLGLLIRPSGKVYAYEANPYIFKYLTDNISINYLHDCVFAKHKAVYSKNTHLTFYAAKRYMGNSSIHEHDAEYFKYYADDIEKTEVDGISLDEELACEQQIDLLKIDIEGGEFHAFSGFKTLLKNNIIKTIVFELNPEMLKDDRGVFVELLRDYRDNCGKKFYNLTEDGQEIPADLETIIQHKGCPFIIMK